MKRRARAVVLGVGALGVLAQAACAFEPARPIAGRRWNRDEKCLEAARVIDVVDGDPPPPCKGVRCYRGPSGDVFLVEGTCDVPPDYVDETRAQEGDCAAALEAEASEDGGAC